MASLQAPVSDDSLVMIDTSMAYDEKVLYTGTYAPWNSQNTLFHKKAFFTLFLPTTVTFRTTDIWRSYVAQKLLHMIGETVAFYPPNAVQYRNAHDYLADFEDESEREFWGADDALLVQKWLTDLRKTGYQFPLQKKHGNEYVAIDEKSRQVNCRRAAVEFENEPADKEQVRLQENRGSYAYS
ncbi:hypothetical protein COOONC_20067 [Cooperia oncophora]